VTARFALATGMLPLDAVVDAARQAESLGYEAVLVGEAGLEADAFVTAAAVLGATERVRCGPGVANAYDRHPVALARAAATLDRLAPGRALLGIGRGERGDVEGRLGMEWVPSPLADALHIVRPLLAGEAIAHHGRRWSAHVEAPPERSAAVGRVPVVLAAVGPRTLHLAGAAADGVELNYGASPEYVSWAVAQVASGARAAGRDPSHVDIYGLLLVACSDAPNFADRLDVVRRTLAAVFAIPDQAAALGAPTGGAPVAWDEAALRRHAVIGTRDECLARIEAYRAAGLRCPALMPTAMRALHG
jgi:alkanesulfonate monooxygenase SsuD/methylene tetrahydromethanopterin reductase-like flavin-dependent oxidoreductase (luciferase family)